MKEKATRMSLLRGTRRRSFTLRSPADLLPFSVPDSPLEEARREWIESQGRSPFIEITVPETAVRLKRQLGRLIRTHEDHGTATILDRRLASKRWGGLLMRGLPDFEPFIEPAGLRPESGSRG